MILSITACSNTKGIGTGKIIDDAESVKIPLSALSEDVKFYEYDYQGVTVKYFAVMGSDGKPRTAFDACDICGGYKGYEQQGNDIKCNNCGQVFSIDSLGEENKGYGCWPSHLSHEIEGDYVVIKKSDLGQGSHRFI